ncbi:response regulator [Burkholderia pseudomallei A79D]|nr:response regulator [Burkholderia pseudomallei A79D]
MLLVEDDEAQANWAKLVLTRGRFDVTHCQTGGQAIRAMTKEVPDAVVLDMRLPDVHGLEVLVWIRRNFLVHRGIPGNAARILRKKYCSSRYP